MIEMALLRRAVPPAMVLALSIGCAPRGLIVHDSTEPDDWFVQKVRDLSSDYGFEPLESLSFREDDLELRVWTSGFATNGFIVRRIDGQWSSFQLAGEDEFWYGYGSVEIQPHCFESDMLAALDDHGAFELEPPPHGPCDSQPIRPTSDSTVDLCRISVDGWSLLIESRRGNEVHRNLYDNPRWNERPAKQALEVLQTLKQAISSKADVHFNPHPVPITEKQILLLRDEYDFVEAYRFPRFEPATEKSPGLIHYQEVPFKIYDDRFERLDAHAYQDTLIWTTFQPPVDNVGRFAVRIKNRELIATLQPRPPTEHNPLALSVVDRASFEELTLEDLTTGFIAEPMWIGRQCERIRIRPLQKTGAR